jgi:nucleotide-binding universal stress UspA family protein
MYKTIVVPLDGSARAERILPHVEALAHKFGATLVLLRVVEPIVVGVSPYDMGSMYIAEDIERQTKDAKEYLAGLQGRLAGKQIEAKTYVEYGPIVSTALDLAEKENADLIALASHGRTGLARVFYGSVAAGILHSAARPLLVIRAQEE